MLPRKCLQLSASLITAQLNAPLPPETLPSTQSTSDYVINVVDISDFIQFFHLLSDDAMTVDRVIEDN